MKRLNMARIGILAVIASYILLNLNSPTILIEVTLSAFCAGMVGLAIGFYHYSEWYNERQRKKDDEMKKWVEEHKEELERGD